MKLPRFLKKLIPGYEVTDLKEWIKNGFLEVYLTPECDDMICNRCASACVRLPLLSDHAISLPTSAFLVHRRFIIHPSIKIKTAKGMTDSYIEMGGDKQWFEENGLRIFGKKDDYGIYEFTRKEEIDSGLIDAHANSLDELALTCKTASR
jgi:hypothetical protein